MNKPIVGITMGDPAGSGPEITIKALADPEQYTYCRPIVVGDVKVFEQARKFVGREDIVIHRCDKVSDALFTPRNHRRAAPRPHRGHQQVRDGKGERGGRQRRFPVCQEGHRTGHGR